MKKLITMAIMVLAVAAAMAQAPEKFTYQAVVRNASNSLVANAPVGVRVSILQGSASSSAVYVETQTATTNANGLVTLSIGGGNVQQGAFADIDWANGTYFLKTETDPDGGTNYSITSTQQMLSVPYALYAKEAGNIPTVPANVSAFTNDAGYITGYTETDPTVPAWAKEATKPAYDYSEIANTPTIPTVPTNVSAFTNDAGYITGYTETDPTVPAWAKEANKPTYNYSEIVNTPELPTVPTNVSAFTNDAGYLTNYTETDPTVPAWAKEANKPTYNYSEIVNTPTIPTVPTNVSAFTNDVGYITTYTETDPQFNAWDKNYNDLTNKPVLFDGDYNSLTNQPTIPTVPTNVSAFMNDAGYLTEYTEQQVLSISNDTIFLTGGSFVKLPAGFDGDYNSLTNTPTIPTVPDSVSAFTNDAGYITMADIQVLLDEMNHKIDSLENLINNQQPVAPDTTVEPDFHCGTSTLTDYDGNVYNTVQIGNQCWMKENMRTMHYSDGSEIQNAHQSNVNGEYIPEYGYLYDWSAVMHGASSSSAVPSGVQGICPTGWHVPSDAEWMELLAYVGSQSDYVCGSDTSYISKALADTMGWNEATADCTVGNDPSANNTTGFSVLPAGHYRSQFDLVIGSGMMANFWSCTESSAGNPGGAWARVIANSTAYVSYTSGNRSNGFSVRCLRDQSGNTAQVPTVTTSLVSEVATTSATCGGNVTSDGGASVTVRGVCWSTSQNPTVNDSHTTDGSGTGSFTSNITGLAANTTYYVRAYATNSAGTAYGEEVTFSTLSAGGTAVIDEKSCPEAQTVTDHEGNVYATVQIGNQCWMRDNLRTTTSPSTGTYLIPAADANYTYTGKQARWYNNDSATYAPMNYGLLYNWNAAVDTFNTTYGETSVNTSNSNAVSVTFNGHRRGICPAGWHLPSDAEWTTLTDYVSSQSEFQCGGNSDYIAKALASTEGWNSYSSNCVVGNDPSTNNATGFSAVPAGTCDFSSFRIAGYVAYFWSSTQYYSYNAYDRNLDYSSVFVFRDYYYEKGRGRSVRCLCDESGGTAQEQPTATTAPATDLTATSATLNGTITNPDNVTVTAQGLEWKATTGGTYTQVNAMGETMAYSLTGLTANTSYTYRAFVTTANGTNYGAEVTFTTLSAGGTAVIDEKSCPSAPTVTDHEGNVYATVQIGNQCWMRDNLRTTTSPSTGTYLIPAADADYTFTGKQAFWYNNDSATYAPMNYGLLYNWNAAVDTFKTAYGETSVNTSSSNAVSVTFIGPRRGICPAGWHLPSDAEWTQLTNYVSNQSEYQCGGNSNYIAKALASTEGWDTYTDNCVMGNDPSTNNATGFSAVPAGYCGGSSFIGAGSFADFWSSTRDDSNYAWGRSLYYSNAYVSRDYNAKVYGYSVRCLRDESGGTAQEQPTATTAPATDLTATSATLNGTITNPDNVTVTAQGFEWKATTGGTYTQVNAMGETMAYSLTGLTANTSYTYRAFVTTANGTSYGEEVTFTTLSAGGTAVIDEKSCPEAQTVTDHEGNVYATVQIGNQCWMRDNLRTTTSPSTGTYLIAYAYPTSTGKQAFWYNNDSATCATNNYGLLYNWNAAVDTFNTAYGETSVNTTLGNAVSVTFTGPRRGICPAGWHLPSDAEWTTLTDYVSSQSEFQCGGNSNYIAKALASTEGWNSYSSNCVVGNDPSSNNATGFSAVPAGYCYGSSFDAAGLYAYFWSSTQFSSRDAEFHSLYYYNAYVLRSSLDKYYGHSVRCLRD